MRGSGHLDLRGLPSEAKEQPHEHDRAPSLVTSDSPRVCGRSGAERGSIRRDRRVVIDQPLIKSIWPRGLLSFGHETAPLRLGMLNVLIGPNGSGKSNLFDVLSLIRSLPVDLQAAVRRGGGIRSWLWQSDFSRESKLEVVVNPAGFELQHRLALRCVDSQFWVAEEEITRLPDGRLYESRLDTDEVRIRTVQPPASSEADASRPPMAPGPGLKWMKLETERTDEGPLEERRYPPETNQSILQQLRSPLDFPYLTVLSGVYNALAIYDHWHFGRDAELRRSQPADARGDRLDEDYRNLALVLNQIGQHPEAKQHVLAGLRELYEDFTDYNVVINSGSVQVYFTESKERSVPANRLSDGTIRYLCVLAMLYNPNAYPIVCLEEPELGLHPDIVVALAKHLRVASERMQILVTTHSDILIDSLSDMPEAVVVFEHDGDSTKMDRLKESDLREWLKRYRLGDLWTSGQIGGTRW